jgi:4-hydroxy-3-methylbut-2-en-1-yl diphosphate synthase IspG/GcpE
MPLQQIATLVAAGVDIVRVAVPHKEDTGARRDRRQVDGAGRRRHPLPMEVRDGGARGRHPGTAINPGNIKFKTRSA